MTSGPCLTTVKPRPSSSLTSLLPSTPSVTAPYAHASTLQGSGTKLWNGPPPSSPGETQSVNLPPLRSEASKIICGLPQESSLNPTLFNLYMAPHAHIARLHDLNIISYTDDTQLILSLTTKSNLHEGMKAVAEWMKNSRLKLNSDRMTPGG
ncbi:hypothetical protein NDU88_004437 [Pleurodeles waltl]|uniref:Reverse transcriptase domain-containing protein n=1 Tax=Pleurodeles waltl TaxID=8319 RepID=A0AAV7RIS4_PLEWA|nr:hypothetical protein NDU88_004437 [Pleurodeles waltl]